MFNHPTGAGSQSAQPSGRPSKARHLVVLPLRPGSPSDLSPPLAIAAMQRSRQLLALGARLRQAAAAAASGGNGAARAWQPAHQQLLSLNTLSSSPAARAAPEHAEALAAAARRQAAAVGRRSFAADAVARSRPAPRGASTAGKHLKPE